MAIKVAAYRHSQEVDGQRLFKDEVEILERQHDNVSSQYIVRTSDGIVCTAIYNVFSDAYYADDVYGIIEDYKPKKDMEM